MRNGYRRSHSTTHLNREGMEQPLDENVADPLEDFLSEEDLRREKMVSLSDDGFLDGFPTESGATPSDTPLCAAAAPVVPPVDVCVLTPTQRLDSHVRTSVQRFDGRAAAIALIAMVGIISLVRLGVLPSLPTMHPLPVAHPQSAQSESPEPDTLAPDTAVTTAAEDKAAGSPVVSEPVLLAGTTLPDGNRSRRDAREPEPSALTPPARETPATDVFAPPVSAVPTATAPAAPTASVDSSEPSPRVPEAVSAAVPIPPVAIDPPPPPSPPAPPDADPSGPASLPIVPSPGPSDTSAIQAVLGEYQRAFSMLDVGAARALWPTLDAKALDRAFSQLDRQALEFQSCQIAVVATRAVADCGGRARYVRRVGSKNPRDEARQWRFNLRKLDDRWLIETVDTR